MWPRGYPAFRSASLRPCGCTRQTALGLISGRATANTKNLVKMPMRDTGGWILGAGLLHDRAVQTGAVRLVGLMLRFDA